MFSSSYIVFSSVQAAVSTKAVRVSCFELFFVHAEYALKVKPNSVCADSEIPRYVAKLFRHMVKVEVVSLKEMFLYKISDFSAFAAQSECGVEQKVTCRKLVRLRCP